MRRILVLTLAVTIVLSAAFLGTASMSMGESKGKKVFDSEQCSQCHAVSSAGIEAKTADKNKKGPDLTGVGERFEAEWIGKYIKKEANKKGKSHTKPFKGSDEKLQALVDWLLEQKAEG